jgi:hypothetical protein
MHLRFLLCFSAALATTAFAAEAPASFDVGGLSFQRPEAWEWVPVNSPMRKAQLRVPGAEGAQAAEVTFFHFGAGSGGDVQANAQRWLAQFKSPEGVSKIEPQEIGGTKATIVRTEGTFSSGMPGGPTTPLEGQALLGAIIEGQDGNVFIKMTGPAPVVKGAEKQFMNFISSAVTSRSSAP